jgi:hypothetical protein
LRIAVENFFAFQAVSRANRFMPFGDCSWTWPYVR